MAGLERSDDPVVCSLGTREGSLLAKGSDGKGVGRMALRLGNIEVAVPVVLAPMAGITNAAFRRLAAEQGAGLYVCEMITSRGLVERQAKTLSMLAFDPLESIRSVQLYGVDPRYVGEAVRILVGEFGVDHVDFNFGCPCPRSRARVGAPPCRGSATCCGRS